MNRQEKELQIESIKNDFKKSQATFVVGVEGLTVSQVQQLRKSLREQGGAMKVAKNTLSKIALRDMPEVSKLSPHLKRQVALVFAMKESPAVAKVLVTQARENEKINIIAGCFESSVIDIDMIKFLGSLPSRQVLQAQMCGALQAPLAQHVGVMHQLLAHFLWVLKAVEEKKA